MDRQKRRSVVEMQKRLNRREVKLDREQGRERGRGW